MIVLVIVGKIGAGKDTTSEYLCDKYGFVPVSYSEMVHEKTRERGLEVTRANLQATATDCRRKHGQDYFARLAVERARSLGRERVILKEARIRQDVLPAMEAFDKDLKIIEVTVPQKTRFERLRDRAGPKDARTWEDFLRQEKREEGLGFYGAAELADFRISNEGKPEGLYRKLDRLMKKLLPGN
jgi:dephospho-CoA kinase